MTPLRRRARRRARSAFTLVEIIAALGVMTIASMTVIALQGHTVRANAHARELAIGLQIAQMWIERFKQDAQRWTQPSDQADNVPSPADVLVNTIFLREVLTAPALFQQIPGAVFPTSGAPAMSNGFDYLGRPLNFDAIDTDNPQATLHYCVSFRPTWVIVGRALRVDVRVWWPRAASATTDAADSTMGSYITSQCDDDNDRLSPGGTGFPNYHFAYLSTVIGVTQVLR